jgi:hypothetical protein
MGTKRRLLLTANALALAAAAMFAPSASALYVEMFAIGDWGGGNCGSSADNRGDWPGMAAAWYNTMGALGHFKAGSWVDGGMTKEHECDPLYDGNCRDYLSWAGYGYDWADAAIIAYHGADAGDYWAGLQRWNWWSDGDCWVRGGNSGQTYFGDQWLKFFHASSCFSANKDDLDRIRVAMAKPGSNRLSHQWDGFHGIMWITSSFNGNYSNTALSGHWQSIALAWVTNHYKKGQFSCQWYDPFNWFGTCLDQCPVAYTIGTSAGDALNRLWWERYNFVFASPGNNNWYAYMYYPNCHPVGKGPF